MEMDETYSCQIFDGNGWVEQIECLQWDTVLDWVGETRRDDHWRVIALPEGRVKLESGVPNSARVSTFACPHCGLPLLVTPGGRE